MRIRKVYTECVKCHKEKNPSTYIYCSGCKPIKIFKTCITCHKEKEPNKNCYCTDCGKRSYKSCIVCRNKKEPTGNPYCNVRCRERRSLEISRRKKRKEWQLKREMLERQSKQQILTENELLLFVERVIRNHYLVSLEDLFVHIITYHEHLQVSGYISHYNIGQGGKIDTLPPNRQIKAMWFALVDFYNRKKHTFSE